MAIGKVTASGGLQTQLVQDRSSEISAQAVSGLGDAVNRLAQAGLGYLNSRTDIERVYDARAQGSKALELDTQFLKYQQDRATEFTEFSRGRSASPTGMTQEYDTALATHEAEFLKTVPPRFQEEMKAKLAQDRAQRVGSAFVSELTLMDTADTNQLNTNLTTIGSSLKGGTVSLEDAEDSWAEMVGKTALPEETKLQFIESGKATLQGLEFGTIVEQTALGYGAVADGSDGSDIVMAGALPQERAVLNVIAKNEAGGYDVWNGGTSFEGYEDHPAASSKAPGESTAAGRYQFILGTWRAASASYERATGVSVPDFSPEWQDRVALHWAEVQYNKHTKGPSFREVLASGDPTLILSIRDILGKPRSDNPKDLEWEGLGHMGDAQFLAMMNGPNGIAGGGTGAAGLPNVWTDPRFAGLSLDTKLGFANAAAAAAENQKAAMLQAGKLERETFLDQVYNAGYSGDPSIVAALKATEGWDAEAQAKYNAGQEVFRASEKGSMDVSASLNAGTPLSTNQAGAFGKWFGEAGFAGIMSGDATSYKRLQGAVETAGIFPEGSVDAFRAAMGSPDTRGQALEFLAMAQQSNSYILKRSGFSDEDIGLVQTFIDSATRTGSQEEALKLVDKTINVESLLGKTPAQITKEADEAFTENFPAAADVVSQFESWLPWAGSVTALNPSVEDALLVDARAAYRMGYKTTGTAEGADAYMRGVLENSWGTTYSRRNYAGGEATRLEPVLMKYPVEKYFQGYKGDTSLIYDELSRFAVEAGVQPNNTLLVADATTDEDIRAGRPPTYLVIGMGEFGEAVPLPTRFGGADLEATMRADVEGKASRADALQSLTAFSDEVLIGQEKLEAAISVGKPAEEIAALREHIRLQEQGLSAARLAALENAHLSPSMPLTVDDPKLDELAKVVSETYLEDGTIMRKVASLAATYDLPMEEANQKALIKVLTDTYQLSNEVGAALTRKVLENN